MPGIAGIITRIPRVEAERQLLRMVRVLKHEEFYVTGIHIDESLGAYVGWTARRGSFADGMPLRNEHGDVVLIYSGEEFPHPDARSRLKQRGHMMFATGPSYLVHAYEDDPSFPAGLNGRFHALLIDRNRGLAMLFNDRYGLHRLYYHESNNAFYFAAEAKAILAVRPELRSLDAQSVGEFISFGAALENRTLFDGISVLPPGSAWIARNATVEKRSYFCAREWENQEKLEPERYYRELQDVFARNLPRYFVSHEPIGMSLTGGLDTRMIMAWQKSEPGSLPCYTFGSMLRENQDVRVARRVARACKQPHRVLAAGSEFLSRFPEYAERAIYLTDGCVDTSHAPDLYLNKLARQIAPVRMTGVYGGEILRGVRGFKPERLFPGLFGPELQGYIDRACETYAHVVKAHPVSFAAFKQCPWYHYGILALEQSQLSMRSPFIDNEFVKTVFRAPQSEFASDRTSLRLVADGDPNLLVIPTDLGKSGARAGFLGMISRATLQFLFKAEYAYDMGMPQWMATIDHAFSRLRFERLFLGRHKIFHFRIWFRDALAGYVREMLLDQRSLARPYVERKAVEAVVNGHLGGKRNFTNEIHKLLSLEILHRLFLEGSAEHASRELPKPIETADLAN
jgi:asparagine synthase (glutamine-hydrolysing)